MSGKVWVLHRVLAFSTGESKVLPAGVYETRKDAQAACDARNVAISALLVHGQLSLDRGQKTVAAERLPFSDVLADLGIEGVGYAVSEQALLGPEIARIETTILLPGSRH